MKKFVNPLAAGGAPVFSDISLNEILQDEIWDVLEALFSAYDTIYKQIPIAFSHDPLGNGVVVSGCDVTGSGPFDVAAGIVYFPTQKIFARVPATASVAADGDDFIYINFDSGTTEQKTFRDGSAKDYSIETAATVDSSGTSANYVMIDTAQDPVYIPTIHEMLSAKIQTRLIDIGTWNMDTTAAKSYILPDSFINKAKIVNITAWIREDPTSLRQWFSLEGLSNGYITVVENDADTGFQISLRREAGQLFDGTRFAATSESRGYIVIQFLN